MTTTQHDQPEQHASHTQHEQLGRRPGAAAAAALAAPAEPPGDRPRRHRGAVVLAAGALVVAAALAMAGVLAGGRPAGTDPADVLVPAALLVATGGLWVAGTLAAGGRTRRSWRVVDIVVASVLAVAGGLLFLLWNGPGQALSAPLGATPFVGLLNGVYLVPAVLGGLVVRKPGAAVYTELVAAVVEALVGSQWGFSTVWYGLLEGLGAELVFALLLYRRFGLPSAALAGAVTGAVISACDLLLYYPGVSATFRALYPVCLAISGAVLAGVGSWALTRALVATGALRPLLSGRSAARV